MKYATARPYANLEKAARRILEIANAVSRKSTSRFFSVITAARPSTPRA